MTQEQIDNKISELEQTQALHRQEIEKAKQEILKFNKMAWSKVSKEHSKPWKWWMHKIFCEWGWILRNKDNSKTYYHHLDMCCKQGFNLYGEKV